MDFALMVPTLSVVPMALAHWPTTAAALVAGTIWVTVAEAPRVTVMAVGAAGVASPTGRWPLRRTPSTTTVEPVIELTMPVALAKERRCPEPPVGAPVGRCGKVPGPPARPLPFAVQAPLTFAKMRTEVAVSPWVGLGAGAPAAVMQSPATRWPRVFLVNLVFAS